MSDIKLYQGDCLEVMKYISDKSVDMILCDLPYGQQHVHGIASYLLNHYGSNIKELLKIHLLKC